MPVVRRAVAVLALVGACGSTPPRDAVVVADTAERESESGDASGATDARSVPPQHGPCAALDASECRARAPRCVWDTACREPVDECEAVVPEPSWSHEPMFSQGDPCENVRPGCGWSPALRRCAVFTPVTTCPATLQEARAAGVLCNHSEQQQLECLYGDTRCLCDRPVYCGGAAPPPTMTPFPAAFVCIPPVDDRGCPTGEIRSGAPCRIDPSIDCMSCSTVARCAAGRWQVDALPPRP